MVSGKNKKKPKTCQSGRRTTCPLGGFPEIPPARYSLSTNIRTHSATPNLCSILSATKRATAAHSICWRGRVRRAGARTDENSTAPSRHWPIDQRCTLHSATANIVTASKCPIWLGLRAPGPALNYVFKPELGFYCLHSRTHSGSTPRWRATVGVFPSSAARDRCH